MFSISAYIWLSATRVRLPAVRFAMVAVCHCANAASRKAASAPNSAAQNSGLEMSSPAVTASPWPPTIHDPQQVRGEHDHLLRLGGLIDRHVSVRVRVLVRPDRSGKQLLKRLALSHRVR